MKQNELISYALDFVSLLVEDSRSDKINKIILFGSVARGDFDHESDIDLFIDITENADFVEKRLALFESSEMNRLWRLKGINNKISIKKGKLLKSSLKRSIISNGIILYGKYKEVPEKLQHWLLIKMNFDKLSRKISISLWRKLYGYEQKVNEKRYISKGLIEKNGGKRLEKNIIIIPIEKRKKFLEFITKNKINHTISEIWSDEF
ncbi:MAG: nucleotidyltransferase domain-containing protein [Candidatus Aenigmatarchaeota archaeon]